HRRLAEHPRREHGSVLVLDVLRHPETEALVVATGGRDVWGHHIEVVEARDGARPMHVVATGEAFDVFGVVEELDREPERVFDAYCRAHTTRGTRRALLDRAPQVLEVRGCGRDLVLRPHPVGESGKR